MREEYNENFFECKQKKSFKKIFQKNFKKIHTKKISQKNF